MYINNSNLAELFRHMLLRRVSKNYSWIEKLESCLLRGPAELFRVWIQYFAINERGGYNYNYNVNLHGRFFGRGFNTAIRFSKINNRVLPSIIFPISVTSRVIYISHNGTERYFTRRLLLLLSLLLLLLLLLLLDLWNKDANISKRILFCVRQKWNVGLILHVYIFIYRESGHSGHLTDVDSMIKYPEKRP